jgi:hypothetical protein
MAAATWRGEAIIVRCQPGTKTGGGASAGPSLANVSAVSSAPGTRMTGVPRVPHSRYRVSQPPPSANSRCAGRGAGPSVARL